MSCHRTLHFVVVLTLAASPPTIAAPPAPKNPLPTPPVPNKSLPSAGRVTRAFDARSVQTVVLRAIKAEQAEVKTVPGSGFIVVSGIPEGGAAGYHPADSNWRETPASRWGLDLQAAMFGPTLVISTDKELLYIHHDYHLGGLMISVPEGVKVIKENREMEGKPAIPDLSPPAPR